MRRCNRGVERMRSAASDAGRKPAEVEVRAAVPDIALEA
jgi:hypothetical protein